jgi:hypothetical protein
VWSAEHQLSILKQLKLFYSKHTDYLTVVSELKVGQAGVKFTALM